VRGCVVTVRLVVWGRDALQRGGVHRQTTRQKDHDRRRTVRRADEARVESELRQRSVRRPRVDYVAVVWSEYSFAPSFTLHARRVRVDLGCESSSYR